MIGKKDQRKVSTPQFSLEGIGLISKLYQTISKNRSANNFNNPSEILVLSVTEEMLRAILREYCNKNKELLIWQSKRTNDTQDLEIKIIDKNYSYKDIINALSEVYTRVQKVTEVGEFSIKGDQIFLWAYGYEIPIRISFFGDNIESIHLYDPYLFTKKLELESLIISNNENVKIESPQYKFKFTPIVRLIDRTQDLASNSALVDLSFTYPKLYFGNNELLKKDLLNYKKLNWKILIDNSIASFLEKKIGINGVTKVDFGFSAGFENKSEKIIYLTKREVLGSITVGKLNIGNVTVLDDVKINDFIVHEDHGIGIYKGIETKKLFDIVEDYLIIEYEKKDKLFVPISQISKISKYEAYGHKPKLTRLNSREWKNSTEKIKKSVKVVATELMRMYAARSLKKGIKFAPDNEEMIKFEKDFEFNPTEDQIRCISEVKSDLESGKMMDRLLVGDVGFGKTEIAMRAAFKAVLSGKQVAVIVPTTILALQHYAVFSERFKNFPVSVEYISRFSKKDNKRKLEDLKKGRVDIIIGTHRLLSNDVQFRDLGLYIIDEEQKFGVKQKEKMKSARLDIHVLSLSATPIPRSLYMSLVGLRDISILNTPPIGRKKVITRSFAFDWNSIIQKIQYEIKRGGQVYFVHNEVKSIQSFAQKLQLLLPDARIIVAHGQMNPEMLEKNTREFFEHRFDILLCTTIIQNGIDVPNVNTIIINKAHKLGLSQLYQLRGRVGRSPKQAYCYLVYPKQQEYFEKAQKEEVTHHEISSIAMDRIATILDNQELGSGFNIASKDLELRGSGSILGYQQAGYIESVGLSLYMQILREEIDGLKNKTSMYLEH